MYEMHQASHMVPQRPGIHRPLGWRYSRWDVALRARR